MSMPPSPAMRLSRASADRIHLRVQVVTDRQPGSRTLNFAGNIDEQGCPLPMI
jgi:hypothetical protein